MMPSLNTNHAAPEMHVADTGYSAKLKVDTGNDSTQATRVAYLLDEATDQGSKILLRRPDRISVSYFASHLTEDDEKQESGTVLNLSDTLLSRLKFRNASEGGVVVDSIQQDRHDHVNCTNPCALLEGTYHLPSFFDVGDVVEYACSVDMNCTDGVCNKATTDATPSETHDDCNTGNREDSTSAASQTTDGNINELHKMMRESGTDGFATTVCVRTSNENTSVNPVSLCQAVALKPMNYISCDSNNSSNKTTDIGITFCMQDDRLIIESISKEQTGLFSSPGCAIKEGHTVVGIDNVIASIFTPEDATFLIHSLIASPKSNQLSITTISTEKALTRWDQVRKAAVAVGGGSMVASGSVLMVTPLHPIGHAMAIGGVGVLATEFEGPRKLANKAKERWSERKWFRKGGASSNCLDKAEGANQSTTSVRSS